MALLLSAVAIFVEFCWTLEKSAYINYLGHCVGDIGSCSQIKVVLKPTDLLGVKLHAVCVLKSVRKIVNTKQCNGDNFNSCQAYVLLDHEEIWF